MSQEQVIEGEGEGGSSPEELTDDEALDLLREMLEYWARQMIPPAELMSKARKVTLEQRVRIVKQLEAERARLDAE